MPKLVEGNWIPNNLPKIPGILFLAEKPSLHFERRGELRKLGNFNATHSDYKLQEFIKKYLHKSIYITDMVKTEGKAGSDFISDWQNNSEHKKRLEEELKSLNIKIVVCLSRKVEKLFCSEFPGYKIFHILHPSYVFRYKKYSKWDEQFSHLVLEMRGEEIKKSILP